MAILLPPQIPLMNPAKRQRRSATTVMAGVFDVRPPRDVLTSLLNGVGPYKAVEKDEEARRHRRKEKRERDKERRREKALLLKSLQSEAGGFNATAESNHASTSLLQPVSAPAGTSSFWRARPAIHIATMQRSVSVTPPPTSPMLPPDTPDSTPGPSISSSTSRSSSKRPRTPEDGEEFDSQHHSVSILSSPAQPRKRRVAVKKGWKGWVEGSPPPSEKLINLDAVPVLQERRTRSGKNFDAIGVGKDGWV